MSKTTTKTDATTTAAIESAKLAGAEAKLIAKYGDKIVVGSIARGTGSHDGKLTVEIYTRGLDGEFDGNIRRVATSDVFQVHHTDEVRDALRKQRAADKRAAKAAAKAEQPSKGKGKGKAEQPSKAEKAKAEAEAEDALAAKLGL